MPYLFTALLHNARARRLEKNAVAVDVLNSNRQLWEAAGGLGPDTLASPTEITLEQCAKTVEVLQAMLQKHGPSGGLDSFTQDIENAVNQGPFHSETQTPHRLCAIFCACFGFTLGEDAKGRQLGIDSER